MIEKNIEKKTYFNRKFELLVADLIKEKKIKIPTYLSVGQEHIAAAVSEYFPDSYIFPQHRCHSWFLSYGGNPKVALKQLLGVVDQESNGMQGSASLAIKGKMFGHSGLLGDQIPIAVGFADAKRSGHTICVAGDAAVEEDYALASLGYAATKKCPILFIVEDNNLSILTEKAVRRSWDIVSVANGFGLTSIQLYEDKLSSLKYTLARLKRDWRMPTLLNIDTTRHLWHAGAGQDSVPTYDVVNDLSLTDSEKQDIDREINELCEFSQTLLKN